LHPDRPGRPCEFCSDIALGMNAARLSLAWLLLTLTACGPKGLAARMANGERLATQAENALDEADRSLAQLEPDRAEKQLQEARHFLGLPDIEYYPERTLLRQRLSQSEQGVAEAKLELARKQQEERIASQKQRLTDSARDLETAFAELSKQPLDKGYARDARNSAEELEDALNDGRSLERESADYFAFAKARWALLEKRAANLKLAEALIRFNEGPAASALEGRERMARARKVPARERRELYQDARESFMQCQLDGRELLAKHPGLDRQTFRDEAGVKRTPATVVKSCASLASTTARLTASRRRR